MVHVVFAVAFVNFAVCTDAGEDVMRDVVFRVDIIHITCCDKRDAGVGVDFFESGVDLFLDGEVWVAL